MRPKIDPTGPTRRPAETENQKKENRLDVACKATSRFLSEIMYVRADS
jgi:hypothetical protein